MNTVELKVYRLNKKKFINSWELHQALELNKKTYWRWVSSVVINNASLEAGLDFVEHDEKKHTRGRPSNQYLISPIVGKAICIAVGSIISKKIKTFIEENFENTRRVA